MLNSMRTAKKLSPKESQMESCQSRPSLGTCVSSYSPVQLESTADLRTWLQGAFPVSRSALPENAQEPTTPEICGPPQLQPSAQYDPATASWRTYQGLLLPTISELSLATLPKAGMTVDGVCYQQPKWAHRINEIGSGLLPTPAAQEAGWVVGGKVEVVDKHGNPPEHANQRFYDKSTGRIVQKGLSQVAQMWPTPQATDWKRDGRPHGHNQRDLPVAVGGKLNPPFVEWLMGWPLGWTDLEPLAMDKFRQWQQQHGVY